VPQALVVDPEQPDHVAGVGLILNRASGRTFAAREHGVVDDPPLLEELRPELLGEREMRGPVTVQMAELPPADPEGELAASAPARPRPPARR
jgi:hypothetical protein